MVIRFKSGDDEVRYTAEELRNMSREELKQIKRELQSNIEIVSSKRADYLNYNNDGKNSKEYFNKMAKYKKVI